MRVARGNSSSPAMGMFELVSVVVVVGVVVN